MKLKVLFLMAALAPAMVFADEPSAAMTTAQNVVDQLNNPVAMTVGVMLVELALRLKKTQNPQSLLYMISNIFKMVGRVSAYLAEVLDNVIQRTKE